MNIVYCNTEANIFLDIIKRLFIMITLPSSKNSVISIAHHPQTNTGDNSHYCVQGKLSQYELKGSKKMF
ncbi:hypothetical protein ACQP3F_27515, partial [Escherichia coli]